MRIVVLGAPGAGKGTQCKRIVDRYGLAHLSSGDILRQHRTNGTTLGSRAQQYMDSGALVPDDLVVEMMAEAIKNAPGTGFVLDGFRGPWTRRPGWMSFCPGMARPSTAF